MECYNTVHWQAKCGTFRQFSTRVHGRHVSACVSFSTWNNINSIDFSFISDIGCLHRPIAQCLACLFIGCVYLLWLAELKKEKHDFSSTLHKDVTRIDICFYLHLTLLVAAVSQAFPSAHLSPHISLYLVFTQQIHQHVFAVRFCAGIVACFLTWVWSCLRTSYRTEIQKDLPEDHEHTAKKRTQPLPAQQLVEYSSKYTLLPPVRLSMHGGSYF
jgi:hypothetical protein